MKNSLTIVLGKTVTERKFVLPQNTFTKRKLFFNVLNYFSFHFISIASHFLCCQMLIDKNRLLARKNRIIIKNITRMICPQNVSA